MSEPKKEGVSEDDNPRDKNQKLSLQLSVFPEIFSEIRDIFTHRRKPSVSLIIPTYNEEKTIGKVIKQAKKVEEIKEIIVIDDNSKDNSAKIAKELGAKVIAHHKNMGKGEGIRTGVAHASEEVILVLDADFYNVVPEQIKKLINPLIKGRADFVKASFNRAGGGRINEFTVKPMLKTLFPEMEYDQPNSGQWAATKECLSGIDLESSWGSDLALFLDAIKCEKRVVEVNIGELKHANRPDDSITDSARYNIDIILQRAGLLAKEHKAIVFGDKTIFSPIFAKKKRRYLEILKSRKIKTFLLTEHGVPKEYRNSFTERKKINGHSPAKIERMTARLLKKHGLGFDDAVLVANSKGPEKAAGRCKLKYCFRGSPKSLVEQCEIVSSLAEILLYLK
jgi:glycosyltransferase involved in cell wall biosynthesis